MRQKIVAGNWKMNNTYDQGLKLASEVIHMVQDEVKSDVKVIMCAPFIHLSGVSKLSQGVAQVHVGAQDCSAKEAGAYTGEVSASMLKSVGVSHVIIGHSERREYHAESNTLLTDKVKQALANGLTPIFCCGEPLDIREADQQNAYVKQQLTESLFDFSAEDIQKMVIAYEPIWAIGTGKTASSAQAQEIHLVIREHLAAQYGRDISDNISILYGGSCKPDNAHELFSQPDVDGGLIGGASLKSRDFVDIVKSF